MNRSAAVHFFGSRNRLKTSLHLLLSGVVLACLLPSYAVDWPNWRGPELNGVSQEKTWKAVWEKEAPSELWSASVGIGFSSVAVADGRVFTLGNTDDVDTVYCFDAETGKELWKYAYPCPLDPVYYEGGPGATPSVDGGRVFTLSKRGHLFCFEAATGKVLWKVNFMETLGVEKPRWGFAGSPLIRGDLLILNVGGAGTAVEKTTGKVVWFSDTRPAGYATPVPFITGSEECVAIFSAKELNGVRIKDGKRLWQYPWKTRWDINAADPIVIGTRIFISSFDQGCALLQLTDGRPEVVWANKNIGNHFNSCVYLDGYLYGVDGNTDQRHKDLRCLDLSTGEVQWKFSGLGLGSLMAADGKLIVLSERGELVLAEGHAKGFKPLARLQVLGGKCWTVPVLANSRLYCRNAQGKLICLDLGGSE